MTISSWLDFGRLAPPGSLQRAKISGWPPYYNQRSVFTSHLSAFYAALLPRRGSHYASHSVRLSVSLPVCPSVRPSRYRYRASRRATWRITMTHVLFGTRWGPHIVRPSRPHRFLFHYWKWTLLQIFPSPSPIPAKIDLSPEWSPRQDSNTTSLPIGSQVVYRIIISMTFSDP